VPLVRTGRCLAYGKGITYGPLGQSRASDKFLPGDTVHVAGDSQIMTDDDHR